MASWVTAPLTLSTSQSKWPPTWCLWTSLPGPTTPAACWPTAAMHAGVRRLQLDDSLCSHRNEVDAISRTNLLPLWLHRLWG